MGDTPRSEYSLTRFSTPVSELDDHRNQPSSLPRANAGVETQAQPHARRGTAVSNVPPQALNLAQVNEAMREQGMTSRDFENAIEDDVPTAGDETNGRRGSTTSPIARRSNLRRPLDPLESPAKPRTVSSSSRSDSPPNSVDAFADPRRRGRAGTITSYVGEEEQENRLQITTSGGIQSRRPTFSDGLPIERERATSTIHDAAAEDICFPQSEEDGKTYKIDYETLEEFVAEDHERTPVTHRFSQQWSAHKRATETEALGDTRPTCASTSELPNLKNQVAGPPNVGYQTFGGTYPEVSRIPNTRHDSNAILNTKQDSNAEPMNRFTFFSSDLNDTIHAEQLSGLLMPNESFRDLFELKPEGGVWWLDMLNPSEEEVYCICKAFGVHPLTREDVLTQEAREKVELFKTYYFMCFRSFYQMDKSSEDYLEPVNVYAIVFREGILTFTFCISPHCSNVRSRIGRLRDYVSLSADWICYALIDDIVDGFAPVIRDAERETDSIEDNIFVVRLSDHTEVLKAIGDCRKRVTTLMRLLGGKADVVKGFAKRCNDQYAVAPRGDVGLYLSDIQDHIVTMMSNLSHFEKMLSRSHANYLAQISIDNINQGNRINWALGRVTLIGTILLPLNVLTGMFGMNVKVPGGENDSLAWFFAILGVIITFVTVALIAAKRMKLI